MARKKKQTVNVKKAFSMSFEVWRHVEKRKWGRYINIGTIKNVFDYDDGTIGKYRKISIGIGRKYDFDFCIERVKEKKQNEK